jgi:hypothetical protein
MRIARLRIVASALGPAVLATSLVVAVLALRGDGEPAPPAPSVEAVYDRVEQALAQPGMIAHVAVQEETHDEHSPFDEIEAWVDAHTDRTRIIKRELGPRPRHWSDNLILGGDQYSAANGQLYVSPIDRCAQSQRSLIAFYQTCLGPYANDVRVTVQVRRRYEDIDVIAIRHVRRSPGSTLRARSMTNCSSMPSATCR